MNNQYTNLEKVNIFSDKVKDLITLKNKIDLDTLANGSSISFDFGSLTNLHFTNLNIEELVKYSNNFDKVKGYLFNIRIFILEKDFVSVLKILDIIESFGLDVKNYRDKYNNIMSKKLVDDLYGNAIIPIIDMFNIDKNKINIESGELLDIIYYGGEVHLNDRQKSEKYNELKKNIDGISGQIGMFMLTHLIVTLIELTDLLEDIKDYISIENKKLI